MWSGLVWSGVEDDGEGGKKKERKKEREKGRERERERMKERERRQRRVFDEEKREEKEYESWSRTGAVCGRLFLPERAALFDAFWRGGLTRRARTKEA